VGRALRHPPAADEAANHDARQPSADRASLTVLTIVRARSGQRIIVTGPWREESQPGRRAPGT
jgi:hypothetical protein